VFLFTPASSQIFCAEIFPIPYIEVNAISTCLFRGRLIPAILATVISWSVNSGLAYSVHGSSLPLLVAWIAADNPYHAVAANNLAVPAHLLD